MMEIIQRKLCEIEQHYNVKILLAIESGSRAWGFDSKNSDYDVRFIYIHPVDWYLSIDYPGIGNKKDVIELPINEMLDISGWEITKALRLLRKGNPSIFEWLGSKIIYMEDPHFKNQLLQLQKNYFNPKAMLHHYVNIARKNDRKYLQGESVKLKSYLYALRSIFACKWIQQLNEIPPIQFQSLMKNMELGEELIYEIVQLLEQKKSKDELIVVRPIPLLNLYIEEEIKEISSYIEALNGKKESNSIDLLNTLFRNTLKEIWSRQDELNKT
jgi:predicted nucleotidyltransferase